MDNEKKVKVIKEWLLKYMDPLPHYSGVTADHFARLLLAELELQEIVEFEKWHEASLETQEGDWQNEHDYEMHV
jgi:hypothetical protein